MRRIKLFRCRQYDFSCPIGTTSHRLSIGGEFQIDLARPPAAAVQDRGLGDDEELPTLGRFDLLLAGTARVPFLEVG